MLKRVHCGMGRADGAEGCESESKRRQIVSPQGDADGAIDHRSCSQLRLLDLAGRVPERSFKSLCRLLAKQDFAVLLQNLD